jgi:Ca2+:H+ antiporter
MLFAWLLVLVPISLALDSLFHVAPLIVFGTPMSLVFSNPIELIAIAAVAFAVNAIAEDGETTWMEGVLLVGTYAGLAVAFFFVTP